MPDMTELLIGKNLNVLNARDLDVEISFEQEIFTELYTHKLFSLAVT